LEEHPLVKHYGLPLEHLALTKAHRKIEGSHRAASWRVLLSYVDARHHAPVLSAMEQALQAWLEYRDDVAHACGVSRAADGGLCCAA
jgi:pyrroloquinoline-quinone synthase